MKTFGVYNRLILTLLLAGAFLSLAKPRPLLGKEPSLDPKLQQVAVMVSRFLQEEHFAKHPIDETVSKEWIKAYMETLDYSHLYFLQTDYDLILQENADSIGKKVRYGDISPAFKIFSIFKDRFESRVAWVKERLKQPFDFSGDDYYLTDRKYAEWPADLAAADKLWEQRLKYELLQSQFAEESEETGELPKMSPSDFNIDEDVLKKVIERHQRRAKYVFETDNEDIVETYLSSLTNIYDPHSQYLSQKSYEDFFIAMNQQLFGIGAILTTEDGYCVIREIIKGGPADLSGAIQVNDRITGVAQGNQSFIDIIDMKLRDAVRLIRGKKGTVVRLEVIPAKASDSSVRKEIAIVRDEIKLTHQKANAKLIEQTLENGTNIKLGVIKLPSFYGDIGNKKRTLFGGPKRNTSTTSDVKVLLEKLKDKGMDGLVLDLRNNGGGLLDEAIRLAGLFVDKGPIVQVKDSKGRRKIFDDEISGSIYNGPLVVLTNKLSASASEIVAGALQNYKRAIVIGDSSTHGKGTVQTVTEVGRFITPLGATQVDVGAVKLTIQKFYLPNGHSTQKRGVIPDIKLPSANDYLEIGEGTLPHALPWDEIDPAKFGKINDDLDVVINSLTEKSQKRIEQNEQFLRLSEDIDELRERLEEKRISLNVEKRINEILEDQERRKEQDDIVETLASSSPDILTIEFDENLEITEKLETAATLEKKESNKDEKDEEELSTVRDYASDLHLKESLNILSDFILQSNGGSLVAKELADANS